MFLQPRDNQTRQIQETVGNVEKHFGELCQIYAGYVRKTARLRDKADLLVREVNAYADTETPNLKHGLKGFADELAKLQDYRQAEVERLEAKVIEPLKSYGAIIKLKRAETELQRATMDAARISRQLEETIDNFEKQKIKDIKKIFSDFVTIEMLFHGKAVEVLSAAFQHIEDINEEEDLEVFRSSLHPPDFQSRLDIVRANSRTGTSKRTSSSSLSQTVGSRQIKKPEEEEEDENDLDDEDDDESTEGYN
ncbi:CBY1-interacting BAR domain-containing protein 1 isoform X2 [Ranitomeya variabilis]|uniref:CBY1-interacting BAR domain-containing protein 1 isoform X2 n=1 Tax=Ranitomeya variabilis TaxID=490064 RepID=UPI0040561F74